jgi:hypothetical protein
MIVCVAGDAGAAAAIAPVAAALRHRGHAVQSFARSFGRPAFTTAGIPITEVANFEQLAREWPSSRPALVIAGLSGGDSSEIEVIKHAKSQRISTLAILDYWSNFRLRLLSSDGSLVIPDRVVVADESAAAGVTAAGVPASAVFITGAPQFDRLAGARSQWSSAQAAMLRASAGVSGDPFVMFVSQPIKALVGNKWGYTETEVLSSTIEALVSGASRRSRSVQLGVRWHPREAPSLLPPSSRHLTITGLPPGDPLPWVMTADLVVGMNSMLLLEAAMLGAIVLSLQPGLAGTDTLP